jgi:hypothetical protein
MPSFRGVATPLDSALLVQCTASQAARAAEVVDRSSSGLVISGPGAAVQAESLRERGAAFPILCDAQRYTGRKRAFASADFSAQWLAVQRGLDGPVLTDSGYVDKRDVNGLRSILRRTLPLGDNTFATLPLHADWLKDPQDREVLLHEVSFARVPVAVALEHSADPLGVQQVLRGLLALLATDVPVLLLRSDVSAIGALCHGAHAAAIGTTTALRHIYPLPKPGAGGGGRRAGVAVFVPHCLSYLGADKVAGAVQRTPDLSHLWACGCTACGGRPMDHFATTTNEAERSDTAFRHSLELLHQLRDELFAPHLTDADRTLAWHERCEAAAAHHAEIAAELFGWRPPPFLNAWRKAWQPAPAPRPR